MRRTLWAGVVGVGLALGVLGGPTAASAQIVSKPIDTSKFVVAPADAATNIFSGTARYVSRAVAGTIESNGFVRTINNLLGRRDERATSQPGGLPLPGSYPSTKYANSFPAALPTTMQFGSTPTFRR